MSAITDRVSRATFATLNRVVKPVVRAAPLIPFVGAGLILVETTGRRSGLPREVPLVAARLGDQMIVSTVRSGSQWMRNIENDPAAAVWAGGQRRPAHAEVRRGPLNVARLTLDS